MPKISVIISAYNVEKYLRQCLDSIINQTFKDFECICVNDGSTDNSLQILEEFSRKDNRFKIIYQENKGCSYSRNVAIRVCKGEYIAFIDSDDFVRNDYLEQLLNIAIKENGDIVYCTHKLYYDIDKKYKSGPNRKIICNLFKKYYKKHNKIKYILEDIVENSRSVCMKLYKSDMLKNNDILFFENTYAEVDYAFNILANLYSNKISFLNEELYYYRKQIKSITADRDRLRVNALKSFMILTKNLEQRNLLKNNKLLCEFVHKGFIYRLGKNISYEQKEKLFREVFEHMKYINNNICKKYLLLNLKLKFYLTIMKILKVKSFLFFRVLKNF